MNEPIGTIWNLGLSATGGPVMLNRYSLPIADGNVWLIEREGERISGLTTEQLIALGEIASAFKLGLTSAAPCAPAGAPELLP